MFTWGKIARKSFTANDLREQALIQQALEVFLGYPMLLTSLDIKRLVPKRFRLNENPWYKSEVWGRAGFGYGSNVTFKLELVLVQRREQSMPATPEPVTAQVGDCEVTFEWTPQRVPHTYVVTATYREPSGMTVTRTGVSYHDATEQKLFAT